MTATWLGPPFPPDPDDHPSDPLDDYIATVTEHGPDPDMAPVPTGWDDDYDHDRDTT